MGNLIGETFAMSVLFGISKPTKVSQNMAFCYAALITCFLALFTLCLVKNPEIKEAKAVVTEHELQEY